MMNTTSSAFSNSVDVDELIPSESPVPARQEDDDEEEYVRLPKSQLEGMVTREEVESLLKQQQEQMEEQMEEKMKSMLVGLETKIMESKVIDSGGSVEVTENSAGSEIPQRASTTGMLKEEAERWEDTEDQEEAFHTPFGETIYTLIYISSSTSQSFWYGIFVYLIQMTTILLTFVDRIDWDATTNALQIPAMVDDIVTAAQGVTILLALAYQSDLIESVLKIQDGFYPEALLSHPEATYATWLFSCVAQSIAGLFLLVVIFMLTMQVDDVLSIMLNFAALHFMAEIDDLGFAIAKLGFLSRQLQIETDAVADLRLPLHRSQQQRNQWGRMLYLFTLIASFAAFGVIKSAQITGLYLPTYLYVQFGDAYNQKIPYYSGLMTSGNVNTLHYRKYRDLGSDGDILLSWCPVEKAWTFSSGTEGGDPCDNYFAKSSTTNTYDVSSLKDSDWEIRDEFGRLQPFDSFSLVSRDCDPDTCQGTCGDDGLCQCSHDRFGLDCEFRAFGFSNVCQTLIIDERFDSFPSVPLDKSFSVGEEFHLLRNEATGEYVRVYNMPVYYSNQTYPANVIFFGGRRWILASEWDMFDMKKAKEEHPERWYFPEKTVSVMENGFHAFHQANYTPFFISDPVDFKTPSFVPHPIGLTWWTLLKGLPNGQGGFGDRKYKPDIPIEASLVCATRPPSCIGKSSGFCGRGVCNNETGICDCGGASSNFYGQRCELVKPCFKQLWQCGGNGSCDQSTGSCRCNAPYFGKLCEETQKCYEEGGTCRNAGVCNRTEGTCICPDDPAISGVACEKVLDCATVGCQHGGICGRNGQCICPPPFYGAHCHLFNKTNTEAFCSTDSDCNNGSCNVDTGICECLDPTSFGTLCEFTFNCGKFRPWVSSPCGPSGTCNRRTGACECTHPYFGPDCSKVAPCRNNRECRGKEGTCDTVSGQCNCGGASGQRCENSNRCIGPTGREFPCHNGGTCNELGLCQCPTGYSGTRCQHWVATMYDQKYDYAHNLHAENIKNCTFHDPFCYPADPSQYNIIVP